MDKTYRSNCYHFNKANFAVYGMDASTDINIEFVCDCDCQPTEEPHLTWINQGSFHTFSLVHFLYQYPDSC